MTGGAFSDRQYLAELLYRHFVFLSPAVEDLTVLATLKQGRPGGPIDAVRDPLLQAIAQDVWRNAHDVPVVFDPYFALSPSIQSFEAKEGWLDVYASYALAPA